MLFKRYMLLLMMMLFTMTTFSQNTINQVDANGKKQGTWKKYNDKKELLYEGTFKNDVPIGEFKYYHSNGKLKSRSFFIQGTHKVRTTLYHENEQKAAEGIFIDQLKDSIWNYYNQSGQLINIESYKNGKKEGHWATYSSQTGILLTESDYSDDQLNGLNKTYYPDGKLNTVTPYINGKINGVLESYYPDNKIFTRGTYHQNLKEKNWDIYDETGHIRKTVEYEKSRIIRTYLYIYIGENGQKINQDLIAYFHKTDNKTQIVLNNGKIINSTESFETVCQYLDFIDFFIINPSYAASYNAIMDYKDISNQDMPEAVEVVLKPATSDPVIAEGDHAKQVKSLFVKELPKESTEE